MLDLCRHGGDLTDFSGKGCLIGCADAHVSGSAPELETKLRGGLNRGPLLGSSLCAIFLDNADRDFELLSLGCRDTLPVADGMTVLNWSQYDGGRLVFHAADPVEVDTGHESGVLSLPDDHSRLAASAVLGVDFEDVAAWDPD